MNYVILNGIKSTLIKGLLIQELPPISKPLMRTSIEEIDGRDGDVVTNLGYSSYDKQMTIGLFGDYDVNEVIQFFDSNGTVIFSNEPDKFYRYQIIQQIDFARLIRFRTATVTFHVQPFKYSAVDDAFSFSNDVMNLRIYSSTFNGVTISAKKGLISLSGTAEINTEIYLPINKMTLSAGNYTFKAITEGTGASSCTLRLINNVPSDEDSFGGTSLSLVDDGTATITADVTDPEVYNYMWFYIPIGTSVDFSLDPKMLDNDLDSCNVFNRGNTKSRPIITLYGSETIKLSINGTLLYTIELGSAEYITLDGEEMNAYKGDILMNRYVTGDYDDLQLKIGMNTISWDGNASQIEIENVSRWI